jgi:hypothetical protein
MSNGNETVSQVKVIHLNSSSLDLSSKSLQYFTNLQDMAVPLTPPKGNLVTNRHSTNGSTSTSKPQTPSLPLRISTDVDKKPIVLLHRRESKH